MIEIDPLRNIDERADIIEENPTPPLLHQDNWHKRASPLSTKYHFGTRQPQKIQVRHEFRQFFSKQLIPKDQHSHKLRNFFLTQNGN
jgi:hypothetical protein